MVWKDVIETEKIVSQDNNNFYFNYINSDKWKRKSKEFKKLRNFRCQRCKKKKWEQDLNTHHLNYACLGHEKLSDVRVLCRDCHEKYHFDIDGNKVDYKDFHRRLQKEIHRDFKSKYFSKQEKILLQKIKKKRYFFNRKYKKRS
jgi:hypothetical protein